MNFGAFAGGLAQGGLNTYMSLSQNKRAQDEQDARNAERARQQADRELAQRTLGRADTTTMIPNAETAETEAVGLGFTPQTYSRAQAYEDYSRDVSDPQLKVTYAGLADQHKKKQQIEAIAKASQYWDTNPLMAIKGISSVYGGVPDGFSTDGMEVDGKPMLVIKNDKTGAVQMHDMSDPFARQLATLRAYSAIDPEKYGPVFQQAMVQFQQLSHQGAQIAETGRHNRAGEGLQQQQITNTRDYQQGVLRQGDEQIDLGYYREDGLNARNDANINLYERGLRGGSGRGAAAVDPYKQTRESRAAQAAWIKDNPGLYSITPEGSDKPVTHPGMLTLVTNAYQFTDPATAQQVAMAVQAQAQQAAVDPQTGRIDFAKYRMALDKGSAEALTALNKHRAGSGQAPSGVPTAQQDEYPRTTPQTAQAMAKTQPPAKGMPQREKVQVSRDGKSVSAPGLPQKQEPKVSPVSPEGLRARNAPGALSKDDLENMNKYLR